MYTKCVWEPAENSGTSEELTGWRTLLKEELHTIHPIKYTIISASRWRRARRPEHGTCRWRIQHFSVENCSKNSHGRPRHDGKVMLKWLLRIYGMKLWTGMVQNKAQSLALVTSHEIPASQGLYTKLKGNPCTCLRAIWHMHDSCYSSVACHIEPCTCHIALRHIRGTT